MDWKVTFLPESIHRFKAVPIKILAGFSVEIDELTLKFCGEKQRTKYLKQL